MNRIDKARVLIETARDLIRGELIHNEELDEPDKPALREVITTLETADGSLFPYAPDVGEPLEIGGD